MTIGLPWKMKIFSKLYKPGKTGQKSTQGGNSVKEKETLRQTGVPGGYTDHAIRSEYAGADLSDVGSGYLAGQTVRNKLLDDASFLYGSSGRRAECIPYGQDDL